MTALDQITPQRARDLDRAIECALDIAATSGPESAIGWLSDYVAGVGGLSVPLPDSPEVARLKATLGRVQAVADSPVEHQCERDGRASWVRLRDLQAALQDGETPCST